MRAVASVAHFVHQGAYEMQAESADRPLFECAFEHRRLGLRQRIEWRRIVAQLGGEIALAYG